MGLFDSLSDGLKNALGQAEAAAMPALISGVFTRLLTAPRRAVSTSPPARVTEWRILGQHDDFANRPERYPGKP
jgi:hypothetical protein